MTWTLHPYGCNSSRSSRLNSDFVNSTHIVAVNVLGRSQDFVGLRLGYMSAVARLQTGACEFARVQQKSALR